jgi:hypothetical protein
VCRVAASACSQPWPCVGLFLEGQQKCVVTRAVLQSAMRENTKRRGQVNEQALCRRVQARYVACGEQPWAKPQHTRAAVAVVAGVGGGRTRKLPTDDTTPNKIAKLAQKNTPHLMHTLFVHVHPHTHTHTHTHLGCKCVRTHLPQVLFAQDVAAGWRKRSTLNVRQPPTVESLNRTKTFRSVSFLSQFFLNFPNIRTVFKRG